MQTRAGNTRVVCARIVIGGTRLWYVNTNSCLTNVVRAEITVRAIDLIDDARAVGTNPEKARIGGDAAIKIAGATTNRRIKNTLVCADVATSAHATARDYVALFVGSAAELSLGLEYASLNVGVANILCARERRRSTLR